MKTCGAALCLGLLVAAPLAAVDLALKDGRLLRDAVVVREDAATVTFRHAGGFTQVDKSKLPEQLATTYPFDAAQAQLDAERQSQEALARLAEAKRLQAERARKAAAAPPAPAPLPVVEPPAPAVDTSTTWAWNDWSAEPYTRPRQYQRDRRWHSGRHNRPLPPRPATPFNPNVSMTADVQMTPDLWPPKNTPATSPTSDATDDELPSNCPRRERSR